MTRSEGPFGTRISDRVSFIQHDTPPVYRKEPLSRLFLEIRFVFHGQGAVTGDHHIVLS